jgi:hypothetical protein
MEKEEMIERQVCGDPRVFMLYKKPKRMKK